MNLQLCKRGRDSVGRGFLLLSVSQPLSQRHNSTSIQNRAMRECSEAGQHWAAVRLRDATVCFIIIAWLPWSKKLQGPCKGFYPNKNLNTMSERQNSSTYANCHTLQSINITAFFFNFAIHVCCFFKTYECSVYMHACVPEEGIRSFIDGCEPPF